MQTNSLKTKFFIGFPLSIDQKMQLNQKKEWKQASIIKNDENALIIESFHNIEYVGLYQQQGLLTLNEIRKKAKIIARRILFFLPELDIDSKKATIFLQVFIS